jgi:putative phosphoribosyl transferase
MRFLDRRDAGRKLGVSLGKYAGRHDVTVLALPRGGVPVGFEVARAIDAPLDVFVVRKLGVPGHEELAMGAIASGGAVSVNRVLVDALGVSERQLNELVDAEAAELEWRERLYREGRRLADLRGRTVIVVDDGLATGSTMRAAAEALRRMGPRRIVAAVPVAAAATCDGLLDVVDETVCAITPPAFYAVGLWYEDFSPTTDDEVRDLLRDSDERSPPGAATATGDRSHRATGDGTA